MQDELKIKISLDSANFEKGTKSAEVSINNLKKECKYFGVVSEQIKGNIDLLAHSFQALKIGGDFLGAYISSAINLNADLEELETRLTGLIAANSASVTSTGAVISANEKWAMSNASAKNTLDLLKTTAQSTGFSVNDLANGFSMFYASSSNQGSINKAHEAFDAIANASKVAGKSMGDLIPMFDSLASGTVVAGSEMGAFMRIVGLTNEELKEANANGVVFDLLIEKLGKFKELSAQGSGTYDSVLSQFKNELSSLSTELGKPLFETLKSGLASATEFIRANHDALISLGQGLGTAIKHIGIFGAAVLTTRASMLAFNGVIKPAAALIGTNLTAGLSAGTVATKAFNLALTGLKTAFRTFLPTAIVFGALEGLIALFSRAKSASDALSASVSRTNAEILKMTANQKKAAILQIEEAYGDLIKERQDLHANVARGGALFGRDEKQIIKDKARIDEINQQLDELRAQKRRLKDENLKADDGLGELVSASSVDVKKENEAQTKDLNANLAKRENEMKRYYNTIGDLGSEWAINEKQRREELNKIGFSSGEVDKIIKAEKDKFFSKNEPKIAEREQTKISGGISRAQISEAKQSLEEMLRNEIAYYEAVGDLRNKELKERELKTQELRKIGLNELQITEYFNKIQVEKAKEKLKALEDLDKEYEKGKNDARGEMYKLGGLEISEEGFFENQAKINMVFEEQLSALDTYYQQRQELITQALENEKLTKEQYAALEAQSADLAHQQALDRQRLQNDMYASSFANGLNSLVSLAGSISQAFEGKNKTALRAYQALMGARAMVNAYVAASNAMASAGNPYLGAAMAAVALAQGMAQVAQIKAQKFHTGGFIGGEPLKRDEVPAILQTGEYVLSRKQVAQMSEAPNSSAGASASEPNIVIINSVDNSVMEAWANSRGGAKVIKNVIKG